MPGEAEPVQVLGAPEYHGVRVDHPSVLEGIDNLIRKGYANEHIIRIIGMPAETVDKRRAHLRAMKGDAMK